MARDNVFLTSLHETMSADDSRAVAEAVAGKLGCISFKMPHKATPPIVATLRGIIVRELKKRGRNIALADKAIAELRELSCGSPIYIPARGMRYALRSK